MMEREIEEILISLICVWLKGRKAEGKKIEFV